MIWKIYLIEISFTRDLASTSTFVVMCHQSTVPSHHLCYRTYVTGASLIVHQTFLYPHIVKVLGQINTSHVAAVSTSYHDFNELIFYKLSQMFCILWFILQIPSILLLFAYTPMTYLSGPGLSISVNIASVLKNNLVVSTLRTQSSSSTDACLKHFTWCY